MVYRSKASLLGESVTQCDVWSLGILAIELADGTPPRSSLPLPQLVHLVLNEGPLTYKGFERHTEPYNNFVRSCLSSFEARPSVSSLLLSPLMSKFMEIGGSSSSNSSSGKWAERSGNLSGRIKERKNHGTPAKVPKNLSDVFREKDEKEKEKEKEKGKTKEVKEKGALEKGEGGSQRERDLLKEIEKLKQQLELANSRVVEGNSFI